MSTNLRQRGFRFRWADDLLRPHAATDMVKDHLSPTAFAPRSIESKARANLHLLPACSDAAKAESSSGGTIKGDSEHEIFASGIGQLTLYGDGIAIEGSSNNRILQSTANGNGPFSGIGIYEVSDSRLPHDLRSLIRHQLQRGPRRPRVSRHSDPHDE